MLAATGLHMDAADSRDLHCGFSKGGGRGKRAFTKQLGSKSKRIETKRGTSQIKRHLLDIQSCSMASNQFLEKKGHF